jgi:hypothetical protein
VPEPHIEYVGLEPSGAGREYTLLVRPAAENETIRFTLLISNAAFNSGRVRFQDAPELCFWKLRREIVGNADGLPKTRLLLEESDFEEYRLAHAPAPRGPRSFSS